MTRPGVPLLAAIFPLIGVFACDFSAQTSVRAPDTGSADSGAPDDGDGGGGDDGGSGDDGGDGGGDAGSGDDGGGDDGDEPDPETTDDDGDGYAEVDGDCDDTDATIAPGAEDGCDQVDEDCDGEVDEDAVDDDEYEPNDDDGYDLGSLDDDPDRAIQAVLHNDLDVDRYVFSLTDSSWGLFTLNVGLTGIPDDAIYGLTVVHLDSGETRHSEFSADSQAVSIDDVAFQEDGGDWEITIEASQGAACDRRYLLSVELE